MEDIAMDDASAGTRFATNSVILRALGEQIPNRQTLRDLCLANRLFFIEFSYFLYRELDVPVQEIHPENHCLVHVKSFAPRIFTPMTSNRAFNEAVQRLLCKMPALQTFVWFEKRPLMRGTVDTLRKSCTRLNKIHYYGHSDGDEAFRLRTDSSPPPFYDFSTFTNLQQLTLSQLRGNLAWWKHDIAHILRHSPGLRSLELTISAKDVLICHDYSKHFFDELCDGYAAVGGSPLCLQSLRCGQGIYPLSHAALAKLTNVSHLEEVHITNHEVNWGEGEMQLYPSERSESGIIFDAFWPDRCPNLRRFCVSVYQLDVHEFLCAWSEAPSLLRRLAFCVDHVTGLGYGDPSLLFRPGNGLEWVTSGHHPGRHPGLPIKLRMVGFDLTSENLDQSVPGIDPELWREDVICDIVASNADSLEGLMICMYETAPSDPPVPSYRAKFYNLYEVQQTIGGFSNLKQLSINGHGPMWPSSPATPEDMLDAAKMLADAAPGLMYISIYQTCWRIRRPKNGAVQLEVLNEEEARSVELFYYFSWRPYRPRMMQGCGPFPRPYRISG